MEKNKLIWMIITFTTLSLIMISVGFVIGYYYIDPSCIENPISYGINKLNEKNGGKFICECYSGRYPNRILFDKEGLIVNDFNYN